MDVEKIGEKFGDIWDYFGKVLDYFKKVWKRLGKEKVMGEREAMGKDGIENDGLGEVVLGVLLLENSFDFGPISETIPRWWTFVFVLWILDDNGILSAN